MAVEIESVDQLAAALQSRAQNLQGLSQALVQLEEKDWGSPQVRKALRVASLERELLSEALHLADSQAGVKHLVVDLGGEATAAEFPVEEAANDPQ